MTLAWFVACLGLDSFDGQHFKCREDKDCPDKMWCHAKRLVTGGEERGNICVPRGENWCAGQKCEQGLRCSGLGGRRDDQQGGGGPGGDQGGGGDRGDKDGEGEGGGLGFLFSCGGGEGEHRNGEGQQRGGDGGSGDGGTGGGGGDQNTDICIPCGDSCAPLVDQSEGGNGQQGCNNGCCNQCCAGCPEQACMGGGCATPCTQSSDTCNCRFVASFNGNDSQGGGACFSDPPGPDCAAANCPSGSSCAIFLDQTGQSILRCASAGGLNDSGGPCSFSAQCRSGICFEGTCRAACAQGSGLCNCNLGGQFPEGTGHCL